MFVVICIRRLQIRSSSLTRKQTIQVLRMLFWSEKRFHWRKLNPFFNAVVRRFHTDLASVTEALMGSSSFLPSPRIWHHPVINMQLMTQAIKSSRVPFPAEYKEKTCTGYFGGVCLFGWKDLELRGINVPKQITLEIF